MAVLDFDIGMIERIGNELHPIPAIMSDTEVNKILK